jgi:RNA polymerase sigma factor (sigma-70 family)
MARARTLAPGELKALSEDVRAGGARRERALARLLAAHEPIIKTAAGLAWRAGVEQDDALQMCRMIAWKALLRWNPDHAGGASPGTWISHALRAGNLHEQILTLRAAPVRPPMSSDWKRAAARWGALAREFRGIKGRDPDDAEIDQICHAVGIDPEVVRDLQRLAAPAASLDAPIRSGQTGDDGGTLSDVLADERAGEDVVLERLETEERRRLLENALARLEPRDAEVLRARFGLDGSGVAEPLETIAARLGVSKERVRQLLDRAMVRLRAEMTGEARAAVAASLQAWAPVITPVDLSKAYQAGLPGIGEDRPPARPAAPRERPAKARRPRSRPQDPRQACLLAWMGAASMTAMAA